VNFGLAARARNARLSRSIRFAVEGRTRRRDFITLLGGAAVVWPFAARAQQAGKLPTIGYLGSATPLTQGHLLAAFMQRLGDLGWTEGRNVVVEYRWAEGRRERADEIAAEFARLKVDVIVTSGAVNIIAAKQAAPATPIVFAVTADPVSAGLVVSLARPGGNITGLASQGTDYAGKQIDLLREMVPSLRRLGVIANTGSVGATAEMHAFEDTARKLNLDVSSIGIRGADDIGPAFEALNGVEVLDVVPDPLTQSHRLRFIAIAQAKRLPAIYGTREFADAGGLMSFGPNLADLYRRAAALVDKILRGTKPADIPVEQPTKFELIINLKTAKAIGVDVPPTLLARADEVIE
jgi:putative ABC transport system substrate-binding protein